MENGKLNVVDFISTGNAVRRAFVEEACLAYANTILKNQAKIREAMRNSEITADDWIQSAKDFLAEVVPARRR